MTTAYDLGRDYGLKHGAWISRGDRNELLKSIGVDMAAPEGGLASAEFRRGLEAGGKERAAGKVLEITAALGAGTYWAVTAEHTQGASVGHPCRAGVFEDPTDSFQVLVAAETAEEAEAKGAAALEELIAQYDSCSCQRKLTPGGERWWRSVVLSTRRIAKADLRDYQPCVVQY